MMVYLENYGQILLFPQILKGRELLDHLRAMEVYVLRAFNIDNLVIIPTLDHCRYLGVISHSHNIVILNQFSIRPLFQFQHPQTSTPRHEQSRPHRRHQRTYLIWGCFWIELLRNSKLLVFYTLSPRFRAHEFCAFYQMAGHRIDYCVSLRHTIQDLINISAISFPVSTTDIDLGLDMATDSFPPIPHMQFLLLQAYTIMF
ncbi:hypothetical protein AAG906_005481 [Vitis piasezkii]